MNLKEHLERHQILRGEFDELLADFIFHTKKLPSETTLREFLSWSYQQTQNPTPQPGDEE